MESERRRMPVTYYVVAARKTGPLFQASAPAAGGTFCESLVVSKRTKSE